MEKNENLVLEDLLKEVETYSKEELEAVLGYDKIIPIQLNLTSEELGEDPHYFEDFYVSEIKTTLKTLIVQNFEQLKENHQKTV